MRNTGSSSIVRATVGPFLGMALLLLVACGADSASLDAESSDGDSTQRSDTTEPDSPSSSADVPSYDSNPGDILSFSKPGTGESILAYDSFEQLRDFSDVVVLATLESVTDLSEPSDDGILSGIVQLGFGVNEAVGGLGPAETVGGEILVDMPLDALPTARSAIQERLTRIRGEAQYLLFLLKTPPKDGSAPPTYVLNPGLGSPGVLAVWPDDGRLSWVYPSDDILAAAIARGEAKTGTTYVPDDLGPSFLGPEPVGLTVGQLGERFIQPIGSVSTPEPEGWDQYRSFAGSARLSGE